MDVRKVMLVGANGHLGPSVLQALLENPGFAVSILTRASSRSNYSGILNVVKVDDGLPYDQLVKALTGQDALVIAFAGTQMEDSIKLADAAFEAGVKHLIPADFGSCDSSEERSLNLIPLYVKKKKVRDHLKNLSEKTRSDGSAMSWTSIINGHFFDYGLKSGLLGIDVDKSKAKIFDDGNQKFGATTRATIGLATARVLQHTHHPRLKNKLVYIQSVQATQHELVDAVEDVQGKPLTRENVGSEAFIKEFKARLDQDPGNADSTEELVCVEGIVNTNWDTKGDAYVNDLLQIQPAKLRDLVVEALK